MLNKVILIGNVGSDVDVRAMQSGDRVANFSLATSERWKDKTTGEKREKTEWHRIVVWSQGLVSVCENYVKKGDRLYIEGQLETRKWQDQSGADKYTTEIVLRGFGSGLLMLGGKGAGLSDSVSAAVVAPVSEQAGALADVSADVSADEIPF